LANCFIGRINQLSANYNQIYTENKEIDSEPFLNRPKLFPFLLPADKSRAWEREAIQLRRNDQALRNELLFYKDEQGNMMGQISTTLSNEAGKEKKRGRGVDRSGLQLNSEETGPTNKRNKV
jgi:hypothetical protein